MTQEEILLELIISYLYEKDYIKLSDIQEYILNSDIGKNVFMNYTQYESKTSKINKTIFNHSKDRELSSHSGVVYFESRYSKSTLHQEFRLVRKHSKRSHNYFIVFQGKTYKEEFSEGILWAPIKGKDGSKALFHWETLTNCKPGDIVYSIVGNKLKARGTIEDKAIISPNPFDNDLWVRDGWLVNVDYYFIEDGIKIKEYINEIRPMLPKKYSPFNHKTGNGNVGYLYEIGSDLGEYLNQFIGNEYKTDVMKQVFEVTKDEEQMIELVMEEEGLDEAELIILEQKPPLKSNKPKSRRKKVHYKKTDFLKKAERDIKKGLAAEKLVEAYEKNYLIMRGRKDLADKIKWVAKEADSYGYDILSFDEFGVEKYIEVKGTTLGINNPFDVSRNEVETSIQKKDNYWVYRVYNLDTSKPLFYKLQGSLEEVLELEPSSYKAYIKD
ncbi:hypothetical protein KQ51_00085 [Candidatus Izimaplasma bacterium HR1]|jgi:uncharacterized protein (UPF0335 family)|uniref:DUF3883 domain-containing protein n=1 Tax=Candidatus Izimoplasma sp. HR1 TaxID=1541959 RepID=UPI0004F688C1|nr:hypothetical protein KQ51_00085 [Candidatus Izimaplasma bacterium HR1]